MVPSNYKPHSTSNPNAFAWLLNLGNVRPAMSLLGFDPDSVHARLRSSTEQTPIPTLAQSLLQGSLGFCLVSVMAFAVWALAGKRLSQNLGEAGFYAVCALVFIGLAGIELHKLVIGPRTLGRFYALFAAGFGAYAVAWCLAWFLVRGKAGEWLGSLAGSAVFAMVLTSAFSASGSFIRVSVGLFITHSAGYFTGEWIHASSGGRPGMLLWGVAYGLGFGAGLGYALYVCQETIRMRLKQSQSSKQP